MPKTALITGATGLLGRQIVVAFERAGWSVTGTGFTRASASILKLDLTDAKAVEKVLHEVKPQVVVHSAANRFPDKCTSDPTSTRALNITSSRTLAHLCSSLSIHLIYISTDYVFPGPPGAAPYEVDSPPAPTNLYGETKWHGELAVLEEFDHERNGKGSGRAVVLRVPVLYGPAERNAESAVNCLVDAVWKAQKEEVAMEHWAKRYPTNTEDVGRVVADIATHYLSTPSSVLLPPILHFSSEDCFTKYEMCAVLAEILGLALQKMVPNTEGNESGAGAVQRPFDCHLSTRALRELGVGVHTQDFTGWWRRELRAFRR